MAEAEKSNFGVLISAKVVFKLISQTQTSLLAKEKFKFSQAVVQLEIFSSTIFQHEIYTVGSVFHLSITVRGQKNTNLK